MGHESLPLFVHWEQTLGDLLDRTAKFPRVVRFTFSTRLDNLALDVLERIIESCYVSGPRKLELLREMDLLLGRLRVIVRLCHERRYLDNRGYEHVARGIDEAGRMVGGWRKQQARP